MDLLRWRNGRDDPGATPEPRGMFERMFSPAVDVEILVAGGVLTLKGEKKAPGTDARGSTYRQEVRAEVKPRQIAVRVK